MSSCSLNVLIACEESQTVCKAFRKRGHRAFSCDIQDCSGGHPEWHIKGDALPLLNGDISFTTADTHTHTQSGQWDLLIAHPPCTYLTVTGNRWFNEERYGDKARERKQLQKEGFDFFMKFVNADCERIAIENPIGYVSTHYRPPDQIIQPYMFGHKASKATCLWLKNLPPLKPTKIVEVEYDEHGFVDGTPFKQAVDENGKKLAWNDPLTAKARSKTFEGIAEAMADQWTQQYEVQMRLNL